MNTQYANTLAFRTPLEFGNTFGGETALVKSRIVGVFKILINPSPACQILVVIDSHKERWRRFFRDRHIIGIQAKALIFQSECGYTLMAAGSSACSLFGKECNSLGRKTMPHTGRRIAPPFVITATPQNDTPTRNERRQVTPYGLQKRSIRTGNAGLLSRAVVIEVRDRSRRRTDDGFFF
jgi:hypothetical protein